MSTLDIRLFGQLEIASGGELLPPFPTKKSKGLFALLVTNRGRAYPREVLAGMFWGDQREQSARKCLRTAIWRMRSIVEPSGVTPGTYLSDRDHALAFNEKSDVRVDVEEFARRIASAGSNELDSPFLYRSLQDAVRLYQADFLDGVYDEWALRERQRLKALLLDTFDRLIACCQSRRDWAGAIMWAERLLANDPLREDVHRHLMRFNCLIGNRPAALRGFERLCHLLKAELGVPPMPETIEVYEAVRSGQIAENLQGRHEGSATDQLEKQTFAPPTVRPLVVMQDHVRPVDLIPSAAYGEVSPPNNHLHGPRRR